MLDNIYGTLALTHLIIAVLAYRLGRMHEGTEWARNSKSLFRKEWRGRLFKVFEEGLAYTDDLHRPA